MRKIIPFDRNKKRFSTRAAAQMLGAPWQKVRDMVEAGELTVMAVAPGVNRFIVEESITEMLDRINAVANVK